LRLRLAARGSALSLAQSEGVARALREHGHEVEVVTFRTTGDRLSQEGAPISGKGIFTKEIDEAVLAGQADVGVHSAKDLPSQLPELLQMAAVPARADARDALIARGGGTLAALPKGARVGTGSPRRRAQLLAARPDLEVVEARGNVDTRLRRLQEGRYDAIVLAAAGLQRLSRLGEATEIFSEETLIPAIGQGALAIVSKRGEGAVRRALEALEDPAARLALETERLLLARLEAGCRAPLAGHARISGGSLRLVAGVFATDGSRALTAAAESAPSESGALAERVASELLARGASELIARARA
jgi:hydroxymethylbilane synthase